MFDCLITGATLVDGTGKEGETGDVAIQDGIVVEVGGRISEIGRASCRERV